MASRCPKSPDIWFCAAAEARLLPMRFGDFSDTFARYVKQLNKLVENTRKKSAAHVAGSSCVHADVRSDASRAPPQRESDVPKNIDLTPLDNARKSLRKVPSRSKFLCSACCGRFNMSAKKRASGQRHDVAHGASADRSRWLAGRAWFRHMIYAPGMLTGYDVKTGAGRARSAGKPPLGRSQSLCCHYRESHRRLLRAIGRSDKSRA